MKKLIFFIIPALFLLIAGCNSSNSGNNPIGGIGEIGGGTGGGVTIGVDVAQDNQGQQYFEFTPNTNVVIIQAEVKCDAQQIDQTFQGDGQTVYSANNTFSIGPLTQGLLQTGQLWTFIIQGKISSSTGTAFTATPTYTVP